VKKVQLVDGHKWLRVADPSWADPLDPGHAPHGGGRWTPPGGHPTLYLNEDLPTARANAARFMARWPYSPADLRDDNAPVLVAAVLPRRQIVADLRSPDGCEAAGLPATYPFDHDGQPVGHPPCQAVGAAVVGQRLRGVWSLSATGVGRELAWFPATSRSRATAVAQHAFSTWFFSTDAVERG